MWAFIPTIDELKLSYFSCSLIQPTKKMLNIFLFFLTNGCYCVILLNERRKQEPAEFTYI